MTIHFVTERDEMKEHSIELCRFPGRHTPPVCNDDLTSLLASWGIDVKQCCMSLRDYGTNIKKAKGLLRVKYMGCVALLHLSKNSRCQRDRSKGPH